MATLITNSKFKQFDANGEPLASGKIYTYIVGTTTNKVTYQDEALTTPHTNPIILDAWGEATIWIDGDTKFYITDSNDAEIRTYPSFSDSGSSSGETPVISSPDGAVLRSTSTETGYIKIQLPMGEWPNTKMMFDVLVFEDSLDAIKLNLAGFANSTTEQWEDTTAVTNGLLAYDVQFGNDGAYPCIYIGAVDSEWTNTQISVVNFFAGVFSYDYADWDDGWAITITTSIGTITSTPTLIRQPEFASDADVQAGTVSDKTVTPSGLNSRTATLTRTGIAELATNAETQTGTDAERIVTPAGLESKTATETRRGIAELATAAEVLAGTDAERIITPAEFSAANAGAWQTLAMLNGNTADNAQYRKLNNGKNVQIRIIDLDVASQTGTTIGLMVAGFLPEHTSTFITADTLGETCIVRISSAGSIISYTTNIGKFDFNVIMAIS